MKGMESSLCHKDKLRGGLANLKKKFNRPKGQASRTASILGKITDIITKDGRLTINQISNLVGILSGTVF